ncbi:MAG: DUF542 domain-containing protein [Trueperaceae bacterium]
MSHEAPTTIRSTTTVNDLLAQLPEASGLLLDKDIDTCCGGGNTLAQACADADADVRGLIGELETLRRGAS